MLNLEQPIENLLNSSQRNVCLEFSASGGAGSARAPPKFVSSVKGRNLIAAYQSLAIATNTLGSKKISTALILVHWQNSTPS